MALLKRHEIPENTAINIMPLLDVIFLLLVFFLLTSSLVRPTQIELDLPDSTSGVKAPDSVETIIVAYRYAGGAPFITLNAEPVRDLVALGEAMAALKADIPQTPQVQLQIDRTTMYQEVVSLMDTVRDSGFGRFSLLTIANPGRDGATAAGTPHE